MAIRATLTTDDLTRLCIHAYNSTGWHSYYVFRPDEDDMMRLVAHTDVREEPNPDGKKPGKEILRAGREALEGTKFVLSSSDH